MRAWAPETRRLSHSPHPHPNPPPPLSRCPDSVSAILAHPDVSRLFEYYRESLEQMFMFYASSDRRTARALCAQAAAAGEAFGGRSGAGGGGLSGGSGLMGAAAVSGAMGLTVAGRSPGRATRGSNTMKEALGHQEFLKFAR